MNKRVYRNSNEKVIAGVCSGLGDYFSIDPLYIRIIFLVLLFEPPIAIIGYIGLWIAIPIKPLSFQDEGSQQHSNSEQSFEERAKRFAEEAEAMGEAFGKEVEKVAVTIEKNIKTETSNFTAPSFTTFEKEPKKKSIIGGIILIVLGLLFLANNFLPDFHFDTYWPLILIAIGVSILLSAQQSPKTTHKENQQ